MIWLAFGSASTGNVCAGVKFRFPDAHWYPRRAIHIGSGALHQVANVPVAICVATY